MTDEELRETLELKFEQAGNVAMAARIRGELPPLPGADDEIATILAAMRRVAAQVRAETVEESAKIAESILDGDLTGLSLDDEIAVRIRALLNKDGAA